MMCGNPLSARKSIFRMRLFQRGENMDECFGLDEEDLNLLREIMDLRRRVLGSSAP